MNTMESSKLIKPQSLLTRKRENPLDNQQIRDLAFQLNITNKDYEAFLILF